MGPVFGQFLSVSRFVDSFIISATNSTQISSLVRKGAQSNKIFFLYFFFIIIFFRKSVVSSEEGVGREYLGKYLIGTNFEIRSTHYLLVTFFKVQKYPVTVTTRYQQKKSTYSLPKTEYLRQH